MSSDVQEQIISAIFERRPIWNSKDVNHKSRRIINQLWEIKNELNIEGKMKAAILILGFLIGQVVGAEEQPTYTTKYDNVDLDEILRSDRLLTGYVNCLLDQGPCTPDGKELKRNIPDAIDNDCSKCTAKQKEGSDRVMGYIIDHRPDDWVKLEEKYLSDGSYKKKYLLRKNATDKPSITEEDNSVNEMKKPETNEE